MSDRPAVSVIIPTYNRAQIVLRAIRSVIDQSYSDFEVLIIDDGSTDDTRTRIADLSDSRIRYYYQQHSGAAAARNKGLSVAKGKYIHFLDSDDYFLADNLAEKVKVLEAYQSIGWAYSDCFYLYPGETSPCTTNRNLRKIRKRLHERSHVFDLLLMDYFVNVDTVMLRAKCIGRIGPFDETLTSFIDMDFFFRTARLFNAKFIDTPLVVVSHQEADSVTGDADFFYKGKIEVFEKTKRLFPEETRRIGFPSKKERADIFNYHGKSFLQNKQEKQAIQMFLKSIMAFPFQKVVYSLLLIALIQVLGTAVDERGVKQ